jgi:hypothetical protein
VFLQLNVWFDANLLSLNYDKTEYVHFNPKGNFFHNTITGYSNQFISISINTTFLGITTENTLSWKAHIEQLIPKLCITYVLSITYGIIFWGNSSHSIPVFRLQKRVIRIITRSRPRDSCRQLFKKLGILPLISQYILSL